jgi:pSer/pThr/pTyr-binding forkhead associated (FHA) protein
MRSWVIGSRSDCDVVVDSPVVSARHCQLTQTPEGFVLEDLGSTNGIFVDGVKITAPTRVTPGESITLGKTLLMPWPAGAATFLRIGRLADNDIVLDDPRVSGHHARLILVPGGRSLIEDLGSSNGTFLNSADRKVTGPSSLNETDTLYFGTMAVPAARLFAGRGEVVAVATDSPASTAGKAHFLGMAPYPPATPIRGAIHWTAAALGQTPVIAILIVLVYGRQSASAITPSSWASVGQGIASTTFALAVTAVWLGSSLAVAEFAAGRSRAGQRGSDLVKHLAARGARSAGLCGLQCAILLAIVYWGSGLSGPWVAMWGILVMASFLGLILGIAVSAFIPETSTAAALLLACFGAMIALGGRIWPLPAMSPPFRLAAAAMPTRWAFEGLLLLETDQKLPIVTAAGMDSASTLDFAEEFFPIDSERMGPTADTLALGSMQIGLAALTSLIWTHRKPSV